MYTRVLVVLSGTVIWWLQRWLGLLRQRRHFGTFAITWYTNTLQKLQSAT